MMNIISKTICLSSVFSLVYPMTAFASLTSAYASLVDTSQNQTFESEPQALGLVLPGQGSSSIKLAAVHFITNQNQLDYGGQDFNEEMMCHSAGYAVKKDSCQKDSEAGRPCPYSSLYVDRCIDGEDWCRSNGYHTTSCTIPEYPASVCPKVSTLFRYCLRDSGRACEESGYSLNCPSGKVADEHQSCSYNNNYHKCICNPCSGYDFTAEQANTDGYHAFGPVCNSCGSIKYLRMPNECAGFYDCQCGAETGSKTCKSGNIIRYASCKSCISEPLEIGSIVYSDGSISSYLETEKKPIAIVFDGSKRLAVSLEEKEKLLWSSTLFDITDLSSTVENSSDYEAVLSRDFDGKARTDKITRYCKEKNLSCPVAEYATTYHTEGTTPGDWYLPATGELKILLTNHSKVNDALLIAGGTPLNSVDGRHSCSADWYYYYSATPVSHNEVWTVGFIDESKEQSINYKTVTKNKGDYLMSSGQGAVCILRDYLRLRTRLIIKVK